MSKDEQNEELGKTLTSYQERKKTLSCMASKARRIADTMEEITNMLRTLPESDPPLQYNPKLVPQFASHEETYELLCDIEKLRGEIASDKKALEGMGVQFPIT